MTNLIKEEDLDKKIIERFITSQLTSRLIKEETDSQVLEEVWLWEAKTKCNSLVAEMDFQTLFLEVETWEETHANKKEETWK